MERKEWLETFIELADSGAPAIEYRRKLRLKLNVLGVHVKNLSKYRAELELIKIEELNRERRREQEKRDTSGKRELESRLQKQGRSKRLDRKDSNEQDGTTSCSDGEALGPRKDTSEDQ